MLHDWTINPGYVLPIVQVLDLIVGYDLVRTARLQTPSFVTNVSAISVLSLCVGPVEPLRIMNASLLTSR